MNETNRHAPVNRVLIVLDAPLQKLDILEMAITLAASRRAELVTLFIEDQSLFHLASLPFAQEIDRNSARERKLDSIQVARILRSQAREISRKLDVMAGQFRIHHSLKIVRGSYMSAVLSAMTGMDVVFLTKEIGSYKKRLRTQPVHVITAPLRFTHKHNSVWVIYTGLPGSDRALFTAHDIAMAENRDLVILLNTPSAEAAEILRKQSDMLLQDRILKPLYTFSPDSDDDSLLRLLDSGTCGLIVMHRSEGPHSEKLTNLFLRELDCPVVLIP